MSLLTVTSLSLKSSTTLRAVSLSVVRPSVSMKVRWLSTSEEMMGIEVSYLMFLHSVSIFFRARGHGLHLRGSLGQDDAKNELLVLETLGLLGAL